MKTLTRPRPYDKEGFIERDIRTEKARIAQFIESCQAVPCTTETYALWLAVWIEQGGKIKYSDHFNPSTWLTPTVSSKEPIPAYCGALALQLLVIEHIASLSLAPTSGDEREGWEWGHGAVYRLYKDRFGKLKAWTNKPQNVTSNAQLRAYLESERKNKQLLQAACASVEMTKQNSGLALPSDYELGREAVDEINAFLGMKLPLVPERITPETRRWLVTLPIPPVYLVICASATVSSLATLLATLIL